MNNKNAVEILLVEDNLSDIKLALKALQRHNFTNKVFVVNDGEEALDYIFSKGKYSDKDMNEKLKVILLDLKLPKVDGLEVLRIIKNDERTKHTPVVILTSSKEEKDIVESYQYGVNSYIVKPLDFDQFIKSVSDIGLYWLLLNESPLNN
jgi:two-component system, response regulator